MLTGVKEARNETSLQKYSLLTNEGVMDPLSLSLSLLFERNRIPGKREGADPRTGARNVRSMKFYSVTMKHVPVEPILAGYSRCLLLEDNKDHLPPHPSFSSSSSCRSTLLTDERFNIEPPGRYTHTHTHTSWTRYIRCTFLFIEERKI